MRVAVAVALAFLIVIAQAAVGACPCIHPGDGHPHSHSTTAHEHSGHHHHHGPASPQTPRCPDDDPCECVPVQPLTLPEVQADAAHTQDPGAPLVLLDAWLAPWSADIAPRVGGAHRPRPPPGSGGICSRAPSNLPELLI